VGVEILAHPQSMKPLDNSTKERREIFMVEPFLALDLRADF
jgi:hypothetical protein